MKFKIKNICYFTFFCILSVNAEEKSKLDFPQFVENESLIETNRVEPVFNNDVGNDKNKSNLEQTKSTLPECNVSFCDKAISIQEEQKNISLEINENLKKLIKINTDILNELKNKTEVKAIKNEQPKKQVTGSVQKQNLKNNIKPAVIVKQDLIKNVDKVIPFSKFSINTLYKDQVWLNVESKVYVATVGDKIGGVIIQEINFDKGIVKTSKGVLKYKK